MKLSSSKKYTALNYFSFDNFQPWNPLNFTRSKQLFICFIGKISAAYAFTSVMAKEARGKSGIQENSSRSINKSPMKQQNKQPKLAAKNSSQENCSQPSLFVWMYYKITSEKKYCTKLFFLKPVLFSVVTLIPLEISIFELKKKEQSTENFRSDIGRSSKLDFCLNVYGGN